jgi:hypothetical protein
MLINNKWGNIIGSIIKFHSITCYIAYIQWVIRRGIHKEEKIKAKQIYESNKI